MPTAVCLSTVIPEQSLNMKKQNEMIAPSHIPVMAQEVIKNLQLKKGALIVDGTCGMGGHSRLIMEHIMPGGRLICIDRDETALVFAREQLSQWGSACEFIHGNFMDIERLVHGLGVGKVDGIIFDLGISSFQLDDASRGFSFQKEGPLDMRMDTDSYISAYDLVNNLNEEEISELLWTFGQERWSRRIARALVQERDRYPISSTAQLAEIVSRAQPARYRHSYSRIHPATRTFQALRIAVNRELEALEGGLDGAIGLLNREARLCVISFHSLEDRIVKWKFRKLAASGILEIVTPKPLTPQPDEIQTNPRSRSAKMRVAQRK